MEYKTFKSFCESLSNDDDNYGETEYLAKFNSNTDEETDHMIKYQAVDTDPVIDPHKINQNLGVMKFEQFVSTI